jgi:Fe-S oxidoreductase
MDTQMSLKIAQKRIGQAESLGAEVLTAACPSCHMNLTQAARFKKSPVKVVDFAEIVAQAIVEKQ